MKGNRGRGKRRAMQTVYRIGEGDPHGLAVREVARELSAGGLALIPTETVYGLAIAVAPLLDGSLPIDSAPDAPLVNGAEVPASDTGYRRIFKVKQRDLTQTVPWLVADAAALDAYGHDVDPATRALAEAFWPGALTLIVRARSTVPAYLQAPDGTVALRASASPVVQTLVRQLGCPLACTSANTHGFPAPASFADVEQAVLEGVDISIDGGMTPCRDASTIVSCVDGAFTVIRCGALPIEDLERVALAAGACRADATDPGAR